MSRRGLPAHMAVAQQRCARKQRNDLSQGNALQQHKEASSEPALGVRDTQDAARAAIMRQALQASSNKHHTALSTMLCLIIALPLLVVLWGV